MGRGVCVLVGAVLLEGFRLLPQHGAVCGVLVVVPPQYVRGWVPERVCWGVVELIADVGGPPALCGRGVRPVITVPALVEWACRDVCEAGAVAWCSGAPRPG